MPSATAGTAGQYVEAVEIDELLAAPNLTRAHWSIDVRSVDSEMPNVAHDATELLRTASVAKVFLLVEVARRMDDGTLTADQPVDRRRAVPVADSGLWQHLATDVLPLSDVVRLVGTFSDNLATNALIELVGLDPVQVLAAELVEHGSMLHDVVRDERTEQHPLTLSEGCAADWVDVFRRLDGGLVVNERVSATVLDWMATCVDLSMVAAAFDLDPLAHLDADQGFRVINKTGTNSTVRCDVGVATGPAGACTYAVICNWTDPHPSARSAVLRTMRTIGAEIRRRLAR